MVWGRKKKKRLRFWEEIEGFEGKITFSPSYGFHHMIDGQIDFLNLKGKQLYFHQNSHGIWLEYNKVNHTDIFSGFNVYGGAIACKPIFFAYVIRGCIASCLCRGEERP